jgi:hypothetical protein
VQAQEGHHQPIEIHVSAEGLASGDANLALEAETGALPFAPFDSRNVSLKFVPARW